MPQNKRVFQGSYKSRLDIEKKKTKNKKDVKHMFLFKIFNNYKIHKQVLSKW